MVNCDETEFSLWRYNSWFAVLFATAFWGLAYQLLRFWLPGKSEEYSCRIVSVIHGFVSSFFGTYQCFEWPFGHPERQTTETQSILMLSSLGYFIYDFIWCIVYQRDQKLMMAHHIYSVVALNRMLAKGYSGAQTTCSLGSMEITNPLLQLRWFLRSEGFYHSTLFTAVEIAFVIFFVLVRIVLGTVFLVVITFQPKNDWDFRLLSIIIYVMSWMFMINIFKYVIVKYGGLGLHLEEIRNKGT